MKNAIEGLTALQPRLTPPRPGETLSLFLERDERENHESTKAELTECPYQGLFPHLKRMIRFHQGESIGYYLSLGILLVAKHGRHQFCSRFATRHSFLVQNIFFHIVVSSE